MFWIDFGFKPDLGVLGLLRCFDGLFVGVIAWMGMRKLCFISITLRSPSSTKINSTTSELGLIAAGNLDPSSANATN